MVHARRRGQEMSCYDNSYRGNYPRQQSRGYNQPENRMAVYRELGYDPMNVSENKKNILYADISKHLQ